MNNSQLEDDVFYGDHAETLVTNPAYQAAIVRMNAKLFESFGGTGIFQKRKREELWKMKRVLDDFQNELELMIRDGNLAKDDLQNYEKSKNMR